MMSLQSTSVSSDITSLMEAVLQGANSQEFNDILRMRSEANNWTEANASNIGN